MAAAINIAASGSGVSMQFINYPIDGYSKTYTTFFPNITKDNDNGILTIYLSDGRGEVIIVSTARVPEITQINGNNVSYTTVQQLWDGIQTINEGL